MVKNKKYLFLNHLWDKESGLSGMFVLLCIMHFVLIPIFGSYSSFMVIINVFWMLFLIAGIFSLSKSKKQTILFIIIPFFFVLFGWISVFRPTPFVLLADIIFTICHFWIVDFFGFEKSFRTRANHWI